MTACGVGAISVGEPYDACVASSAQLGSFDAGDDGCSDGHDGCVRGGAGVGPATVHDTLAAAMHDKVSSRRCTLIATEIARTREDDARGLPDGEGASARLSVESLVAR